MFLNLPVLLSKGDWAGMEKQEEKKTVPGSNHQSVTEVLFRPQGNSSFTAKPEFYILMQQEACKLLSRNLS